MKRWINIAVAALLACLAVALLRTEHPGQERSQEPEPAESASVIPAAQDQAPAGEDERVDFNRDIRPILSENCFACHGPDAHDIKGDTQLHTAELAVDDYLITPGDLEASEVWLRINDDRDPMPPAESHKELTDEQIALIGRWIEQGAEYQPHWAYVAPRLTDTPEVENADWPTHWIDHYVLARLEGEGLAPVGDADRVTLVRRLTFDLTGLPPTPQEVQAFVEDDTPDAYERLVDRLLASDHFGERMAMYWLDMVRFADTVGYHGDQTQSISPYRDWVIWAFNENLPYSTFMTHQIAGDLVEDPDGFALIASAYNRLYQTSHEGGIQRAEYTAIYDADRVRNFGEAFMGSTIGCAQCHDHKYDPYTAQDFYALAAFFGQVDDLWHLPPAAGGRFSPAGNTNPTRRDPAAEVLSPLDAQRRAALTALLEQAQDAQERTAIQAELDAIAPRLVMVSQQHEPDSYREVRYLPRGNWLDESGDVMQPAVPTFMGELDVEGTPTRLDLANWLVTPMEQGGSGELNARVMVNRLWYLFFGQGLCTTLGDFGGQGMPPNHPELLDRLTLEFVASGWDVKAMIKTMLMTRAYQLSTQPTEELLTADPNNELYARQSQHRLQAEMIRDNALMIGGLLVNQLGGDSVRPYQPAGYYMHLNFPRRNYRPSEDAGQWRRGVYMHWQRQFLHPMLKAFDAPSREECVAQRPISNTPLAALVLLNDPTFVEAARHFAQRILTESPQGDDRQRLDWAMNLALSRSATDAEAQIILGVLHQNRQAFAANPAAADELLSVGLSPRNEELDKTDHAAWTEVGRLIFNLHETITRP